jgi:predicted DNA-binding transcriptional regulator AlpA
VSAALKAVASTLLVGGSDRLIRVQRVKDLTGIKSDSAVYRMIQAGRLPQPRYLGGPRSRRVWLESEVLAYLNRQLGATEGQP